MYIVFIYKFGETVVYTRENHGTKRFKGFWFFLLLPGKRIRFEMRPV